MGIFGLFTYIKDNEVYEQVSLKTRGKELRDSGLQPKLILDLMSVVISMESHTTAQAVNSGLESMYTNCYGGDLRRDEVALVTLINGIRHVGIEPVCIVDGPIGSNMEDLRVKYKEWVVRHEAAMAACGKWQEACQGLCEPPYEVRVRHSRLDDSYVSVLLSMNVKIIICRGEADPVIIKEFLSSPDALAIVSSDTDFIAAKGCTTILLPFFDITSELGCLSGMLNSQPEDIVCCMTSSEMLCRCLDLKQHQLPELAVLCGNDFTKGLNKQLHVFTILRIGEGQFTPVVPHVAAWLQQQHCTLFENETFQELMTQNGQYHLAVSHSVSFYQGVVAMDKHQDSDNQFVLELVDRGELSLEFLAYLNSIKWRRAICADLTVGEPSCYDLTQPIRNLIYLFLGKTTVKELGSTSQKSFDVVNIPVSFSTEVQPLAEIRSHSSSQKLLFLFDLVMSSLSRCTNAVPAMPVSKVYCCSHQAVILASGLVYLLKLDTTGYLSKQITKAELQSIVVACISCSAELQPINFDNQPGMRAVTLGNLFTLILQFIEHLSQLLGVSTVRSIHCATFFQTCVFVPICLAGSDDGNNFADVALYRQSIIDLPHVQSLLRIVSGFRSCVHSLSDSLQAFSTHFSAAVEVVKQRVVPAFTAKFEDRRCERHLIISLDVDADHNSDDEYDDAVDTIGDTLPTAVPGGSRLTLFDDGTQVQKGQKEVAQPTASGQLPIMEHKQSLLNLFSQHQISFIAGETGSGKSTKVPQFILEQAQKASPPANCHIIVSQPRRIAAKTLAQRVAGELGEDVGRTVGYCIGGDYHRDVDTRVTYATAGYLLQVFVNNPQVVSRYTHIIIDEVHERSVDSDFLCLVVRQLAVQSPEVKVILMSATLEDDRFCTYFKDAYGAKNVSPVYHVGSSRFPVDVFYLDTVKNLFQHYPQPDLAPLLGEDRQLKLSEGRRKALESVDKSTCFVVPHKRPGFANGRQMDPALSRATIELGCNIIISLANLGESVLVFLPGYSEIMAVHDELLLRLNCFEVAHFFKVFVLHSQVPLKDQEEAFVLPAPDIVHVFLATNIAESSITLPKLRLVIDCCLKRELIYDTKRHLSCLQKVWCSQSSCKQRAGRTGRVFCGVAVRMVTEDFFLRDMPVYDNPEMLKASLAKLVLQAKLMGPKIGISSASQFLRLALQPPSLLQLDAAMQDLNAVGAISGPNDTDVITFLGNFSLSLPVDLALCRLILLGLCFGCPVDAVVIAASMSMYQDVFLLPSRVVEKNDDTFLTSLRRSWDARCSHDKGLYSEPLMYVELFRAWLKFRNEKLKGKSLNKDRQYCAKQFCSRVAVSWERLLLWESSVGDIALRILKHIPNQLQLHEQMQALSVVIHFGGRKPSSGHTLCANPSDKCASGPSGILQFCDNSDILKVLLAASYCSNFMWGTRECNFPDVQGQKSLKRVQQVKALGVDLTRSVILPGLKNQKNLSQVTSDHLKEVATFVCADKRSSDSTVTAQGLGVITLNYTMEDNPATARMRGMMQPVHGSAMRQISVTSSPLMNDIITLWQFGERRPAWSLRTSTEQLPRPQQPYMLTWQLLSHAREFCRAFHSWRNPFGSLVDNDHPTLDFFAVAAELQGTERPHSVNARGLTVLSRLRDDGSPSKLPYLSMLAFQSKFGSISLLHGASKDSYKALKINSHQLNLPTGLSITLHDLLRVNYLRFALSKVIDCTNATSLPTDLMMGIPTLLHAVIQEKDLVVKGLSIQMEFDKQTTCDSGTSSDSERADSGNWVVVLEKHTTHQDWYDEDTFHINASFFPVLSVPQLPHHFEIANLPVHDLFNEICTELVHTKSVAKSTKNAEHDVMVKCSYLPKHEQAIASQSAPACAGNQRKAPVACVPTGRLRKELQTAAFSQPKPSVKLPTCSKPKSNVKLAACFQKKPSTIVPHSHIFEGPQEVSARKCPVQMLSRAASTALSLVSYQPGGVASFHVLQTHVNSPFAHNVTIAGLQAFYGCLRRVCTVSKDSVEVKRDYLMYWKADQSELDQLCLWYKSYPGVLSVMFESNQAVLGDTNSASTSPNSAGAYGCANIDGEEVSLSSTRCVKKYIDTASKSYSGGTDFNTYLQNVVFSVGEVLKSTATSGAKLTKFSVLRCLPSSPFGDKASNKCQEAFFSCLKPSFSVTWNGVSMKKLIARLTAKQLHCLKEWYSMYPHSVKAPFVLSSACDVAQQNEQAQNTSTSLSSTADLPYEHACTLSQDTVVRVLVHDAIECIRFGQSMGVSDYFEHLRMSPSSPFASNASNTALNEFFMCLGRFVTILCKQKMLVRQRTKRMNAAELSKVRNWLDRHSAAVKQQLSLQGTMLCTAALPVPVAKPEQLNREFGCSDQIDEVHQMLCLLVRCCQMNGCCVSIDDDDDPQSPLSPFLDKITSNNLQHLAILLPRIFSYDHAKNALLLKDQHHGHGLSEREYRDASDWYRGLSGVLRAGSPAVSHVTDLRRPVRCRSQTRHPRRKENFQVSSTGGPI